MTIRDLEYAIAVYDEGTFSAASEKLHITQPTLSLAIKRIEDEFNFQMFVKDGRYSTPTDQGRVFIEQGRVFIKSWQHFTERMSNYSKNQENTLTIATSAGLCKNVFPYLERYINKNVPELKIEIIEESSDNIEKMCMMGTIGLGFVLEDLANPSIGHRRVVKTDLLVAVPKSHPFCKKHPYNGINNLYEIDLKELKDTPFVIVKHKRSDDLVYNVFKEAGFLPEVNKVTKQWNVAIEYTKINQFPGLIDSFYVYHSPNDDETAYYRIKGNPGRWLDAVYNPDKILSDKELQLIEIVRDTRNIIFQEKFGK